MSRSRRSVRIALVSLALLVCWVLSVEAHDLFLKPNDFFVAPHTMVSIRVLNGTFTTSEASVTRARLRDLSISGPTGVAHPDTSTWTDSQKESTWRVDVGEAGTYVLGASVLPRTLQLSGKDFNAYLAEDGLPDVLVERRAHSELDRATRERYSKHVKTILQVGDARSEKIDVTLGYTAELVPIDNPYSLRPGGVMRVRAVVDGRSVPNQVVLAGGHTTAGKAISPQSVRTNTDGVARIQLLQPGVWFVKFINMRKIPPTAGDSVDYESKWATITFAVR